MASFIKCVSYFRILVCNLSPTLPSSLQPSLDTKEKPDKLVLSNNLQIQSVIFITLRN